jgi:hypothetical protein
MELFDLLDGQAVVIVGKEKNNSSEISAKNFSLMYQSNYVSRVYFLLLSKTGAF